jgi:multidrug efflux pump subunit AcrA (membrane-fusion protein)
MALHVTRLQRLRAVTATDTPNPVVNVQVGSQVSGNISKLLVDFNSQVKAGQVVAQIAQSGSARSHRRTALRVEWEVSTTN